ncbi:glycosyltransferase [Streptococcus suis]|nr:glycosyltransferase [Streptococcus suis]
MSECNTCIFSQNLSDFELLIIEDCSTDNTLSILREFEQSDPRVTVIESSITLVLEKKETRVLNLQVVNLNHSSIMKIILKKTFLKNYISKQYKIMQILYFVKRVPTLLTKKKNPYGLNIFFEKLN